MTADERYYDGNSREHVENQTDNVDIQKHGGGMMRLLRL